MVKFSLSVRLLQSTKCSFPILTTRWRHLYNSNISVAELANRSVKLLQRESVTTDFKISFTLTEQNKLLGCIFTIKSVTVSDGR